MVRIAKGGAAGDHQGADDDGAEADAGDGGKTRADPLFVGSLEKGLCVLLAFGSNWDSLGLRDIAAAAGISLSAAQRFTHTLTRLGYLKKHEQSRRYRPTPKVLDFAYQYLHASPLSQVAMPYIAEARDECRETINVSELDATEVVSVIRMPSCRRMRPSGTIGKRLPAFCTASGRAILAFLPEGEAARILDASDRRPWTSHTLTDPAAIRERIAQVRRHGYCLIEEEVTLGEIAVAAPILGHGGQAIAAMAISVSTAHWTADAVRERLAPVAVETTNAISRSLGGWPTP